MATINTASTYVVNFTDSVHRAPLIITNGNANTSTSLVLPGPNYRNYGPVISENFLHLLENFANPVAPYPPVKGQLWYDTSGSGKLKINLTGSEADWIPANGIYQQNNAPTTASSGDVWVDTKSRQLNIYSGSEWLLIGPQFSSGLMTGSRSETIVDTNGTSHVVVKEYVNGDVMSITTKAAFTPALVINGFTNLYPGINVTKAAFKGIPTRINGVSTSSEALQVTSLLSIPADQFVRKDAQAIDQLMLTDLTFDNANALKFGDLTSPVLSISKSAAAEVVISTNQANGRIVFKGINNTTNLKHALVIQAVPTSDKHKVGINVIDPLYELHVNGRAYATNATVDALTVNGTISVSGAATFGSTLAFTSTMITSTVVPSAASTSDIGSVSLPYRKIYADSFEGAASHLTYPSRFKLGDQFTSNLITTSSIFIGDGADVTIEGQLASTAITNQQLWSTKVTNTATMLVAIPSTITTATDATLYKVTKRDFLLDVVPAGTVMLWGGGTAPDGWLPCTGGTASVEAYPELYLAVGTMYGIVSVGRFSLPDLPVVNSPAGSGRYSHDLFYIIKY